MLWDRGTWEPEGDAAQSYRRGKLVFRLHGERLQGRWALIRMGGAAGEEGKNWLLKKLQDDHARSGDDHDFVSGFTTSVVSGRSVDEIAGNAKPANKIAARSRRSSKTPATECPDRKVRQPDRRGRLDAASLAGAALAKMPAEITPELPSLVQKAPQGPEWLHELKLDGYRILGFVRDGRANLFTRRGNDWTHRFPAVATALQELAGSVDLIVDGEVVALRPDGTSDFQALQNMMRQGNDQQIAFCAFDLLYYSHHDLREVPLIERKKLLSRLMSQQPRAHTIRYNDHITGDGSQVFSIACRHALEGIVAKRADSHYVQGRTTDWVKVKCIKRQEFVIGGWTEPSGGREALGALLVGYFRAPSELVYCGRVGTGFSQQSLRDVHQLLVPLEQKQSPFFKRPAGVAARGAIHWVKPKAVAEVAFSAWTDDGLLRHASFEGIREDKPPTEITREWPVDHRDAQSHNSANARQRKLKNNADGRTRPAKTPGASTDVFSGVRLTHPDRVLFPDEHITKRDLAAYYTAVGPFILPHVVDRPLSLVRCPEGSGRPCFFQKHLGESMPQSLRGVSIKEKAGTGTYIAIGDLAGLISLVQMGVLEIHPWGSLADRPDRPDRLIFDMDPAPDLGWGDVVRAARQVKERLDQLGLVSFARTTGGKGLHVVLPLIRRASWAELKALAKSFVDSLVRAEPKRYIAQSSKAKRTGKIFLDYLRNDQGSTAIASYSTRARPGAPVATPLSWDELSASLRPARFNTKTIPQRLRTLKQDPWHDFFEIRQATTREMRERIESW
jgi:bifunctional non-homologous end joining protein LigD